MDNQNDKNINFEINLLPVISLLAVLISFLLITAVWVNVGTMDVNQALGNETENAKKNPPSLWAKMSTSGTVTFLMKDVESSPRRYRQVSIRSKKRRVNIPAVEKYTEKFFKKFPEIKTALVLPSAKTPYEDVVLVMDRLRRNGIRNVGIAPL